MPPPTMVGGDHYVPLFPGRSSVRPLKTLTSRDAILLYSLLSVEGFQLRNLQQIFIVRARIAEKGNQGQRSEVKVIARPDAFFRHVE